MHENILAIHLAEYDALKREQGNRMDRRDHLVYATLTAIVAAVGAVVLDAGREALLLLPPVCLALGWTYQRNDRKVGEIGMYLRGHLAAQLEGLVAAPAGTLLAWENHHRQRTYARRTGKVAQLFADLVVFVLPALAAAVGGATAGSVWALTAAGLAVAASLGLAAGFVAGMR